MTQKLLEQHQDLSQYSHLDDYLLYKEVRYNHPVVEEDGLNGEDFSQQAGTRYIICHNEAKAPDDKEFREQTIAEAEEQLKYLQESLASEVPKRGRKITAVINQESLRDGMFLIKTNALLPAGEVVKAYKNLMRVENAFREIKDFIRLRPIYHYNDDRVKGHVMICVLAYLFEQQLLEVKYQQYIEAQLEQAARIPLEEVPRQRKRTPSWSPFIWALEAILVSIVLSESNTRTLSIDNPMKSS